MQRRAKRGRPAIYGQAMVPVSITLPAQAAEALRRRNKSLSAAIREIVVADLRRRKLIA